MRPITISKTGTGQTAWVPLDYHKNPFNVGFGCVTSGTVTYTIEHTFDDPNSSPTAFSHSDVASKTANADGNYAFPVRAIRANVTAGSGTVTVNIIQAGI